MLPVKLMCGHLTTIAEIIFSNKFRIKYQSTFHASAHGNQLMCGHLTTIAEIIFSNKYRIKYQSTFHASAHGNQLAFDHRYLTLHGNQL
jgi:hypothetical protein